MQNIIARWDKFLASIEERLQAVHAEAREGCAMLLQQADLDPQAMSNAWTAMELRAKQLGTKVDDTWNDKVDPAFDEVDAPSQVVDTQRAKAEALSERIEVETERVRIAIYADAARKIWQRALEEAPTQINCTQCAAAFDAPKTIAAVNVTCQYCSAVNTFEPGMRARMIEHFCAHPLSEEATWSLWLAMRAAEDKLREARPETLAHFQAYEDAQITYWRAYLEARANMLPHLAPALEADLKGKLAHYYDRITHEKAWAEAGRPRKL